MSDKFAEIAFTPSVKKTQEINGSRRRHAHPEEGQLHHDVLGPNESAFLAERDSLYISTVSETGWPYVQYRGGPPGFVRVFDQKTIGFSDYRGNRQYVTVGNLVSNDRVAVIFMDYPRRARLKILGRARLIGSDDKSILDCLSLPDDRAVMERGFLITVEAFDWNCSQHITPRFTSAEVERAVAPLHDRIAELEQELSKKS